MLFIFIVCQKKYKNKSCVGILRGNLKGIGKKVDDGVFERIAPISEGVDN